MGIQFNFGDHQSAFDGWTAIPGPYQGMAKWARAKAWTIARTKPSANAYFLGLPFARSLTDLLSDSSLWINYGFTTNRWLGYTDTTNGGVTEICMYDPAFQRGRWTVLAVLIHELAHVDGAPDERDGGSGSMWAENAVLACGLGYVTEQATGIDDPTTPYDPQVADKAQGIGQESGAVIP